MDYTTNFATIARSSCLLPLSARDERGEGRGGVFYCSASYGFHSNLAVGTD